MRIKVEQQENGMWLAENLDASGLLAWGDTPKEAVENLRFLESRLSADPARTREPGADYSKDDLPNKIHMALCGIVPLVIFFLALFVFKLSSPIAAFLCFVSGVASMFVLTPLTALIYLGVARIKYGEVPNGVRVYTTDAGCSSLAFVIIFLLMFGAMSQIRRETRKTTDTPTKMISLK